MTALDLYHEATRRGLQLEARDGGKLAVSPPDLCTPDFVALLRHHKHELLDLLEANRHALPPDCAPWLHVARQILAGEFDGASGSTVESLKIGLRHIEHPRCREALARLQTYSKP